MVNLLCARLISKPCFLVHQYVHPGFTTYFLLSFLYQHNVGVQYSFPLFYIMAEEINKHQENLLKILTVNCQGLGDGNKRKDVFQTLRNKNYHTYFLQDTHFTEKEENMIKSQWGYKAFFSSFKSNSRGVAILFNNNCELEVQKHLKMIVATFLFLMFLLMIYMFYW